MNTDLFVLTFDSPTGADSMLQTLKDLQDDYFIELLDAVIVTKDSTGNVQIRQPLTVDPGKGAAFGALTGAIVGMLGGPGGAIVGLVSGAVTGGATAATVRAGLPQDDIRSMAIDELSSNGSALMVYLDEVWVDQLEETAQELKANIARHAINEQRKIAREKAAEARKERIDGAYQSWQTKVDNLKASVKTLRQQVASNAKTDRAAVQKQLDSTNAALQTYYKNMLQTLDAWQREIDDSIDELEADAKSANAEAKADINRRLASAKAARVALRAHVKDTLTARLNAGKADIDNLKAQASKAQGQAKDKLNQRIAKLQADWAEEDRRLDELDKTEGEAWTKLVKSLDDSFNAYDTSIYEAENEYAKNA